MLDPRTELGVNLRFVIQHHAAMDKLLLASASSLQTAMREPLIRGRLWKRNKVPWVKLRPVYPKPCTWARLSYNRLAVSEQRPGGGMSLAEQGRRKRLRSTMG